MAQFYRLVGIEAAMELMRPGATWEITDGRFTKWDDPRPCPTWSQVEEVIKKAREFEDSIDIQFTDEQIRKYTGQREEVERAF